MPRTRTCKSRRRRSHTPWLRQLCLTNTQQLSELMSGSESVRETERAMADAMGLVWAHSSGATLGCQTEVTSEQASDSELAQETEQVS